jgi:hypothetical protein
MPVGSRNSSVFKANRKSEKVWKIYFFTALNENDIGLKSVNKAGELLSKAVINDYIDTNLASGIYFLVTELDRFSSELNVLNKKLSLYRGA